MAIPNKETRAFRVTELRVTQSESGSRTLVGYAAVFGSPSEDFGGWTEVIDSGAFTRTLSEGADVRCLVEHDPARIVGRTKSRTLRVTTDDHGLRFECDLPDTSVARDLIVSIERGDLDACSFGFIAQKQEWLYDETTDEATRTLLDVDLLDTSVVAYPAYLATSVSVRSLPDSMPVEMRSRFEARRNASIEVQMPAEERALTDQCTCACPQCLSGACGICSADPRCDGVEQKSADNWQADTMLRLRIAEAS
jgi:hypothetical protein